MYTVFERYTDSPLLVLCRSHSGGGQTTGDYESDFNNIVGANTAVSEEGKQILKDMFIVHSRNEPYKTSNGYEVRFVSE